MVEEKEVHGKPYYKLANPRGVRMAKEMCNDLMEKIEFM
jgi:hypothetical protein